MVRGQTAAAVSLSVRVRFYVCASSALRAHSHAFGRACLHACLPAPWRFAYAPSHEHAPRFMC
eukprot:5188299-Pleurochrysis_carterae.AAC.1